MYVCMYVGIKERNPAILFLFRSELDMFRCSEKESTAFS